MANIQDITKLREQTGAGMVDCQKALAEANGDYEQALMILRKKGEAKAIKKMAERQAKEGIVYSYIHSNNKVGVLLELFCETDFVARTEDFKNLARDLGMQIAALAPDYLQPEDVPAAVLEKEQEIYREQMPSENKPAAVQEKIIAGKLAKYYAEVCLLCQPFIKDESLTVADLIKQVVAKTGEKIEVGRFTRFQI